MNASAVAMSPAEIDAILDAHFQAEAKGDVPAALATFTDDVVHDVVGDPAGVLHGPQAAGDRYAHLFANVTGEATQVTRRLYGDTFVVDDKMWTARVNGEFMGIPGRGRRIDVRILHVFEFKNGRICRENVWIDGASAIAQLTSP